MFIRYPTVTVPPPTVTVDEVFCDFGPVPSMPLCEWQNGNGALEWIAGTGMNTNWLGGPSIDATSSTSHILLLIFSERCNNFLASINFHFNE